MAKTTITSDDREPTPDPGASPPVEDVVLPDDLAGDDDTDELTDDPADLRAEIDALRAERDELRSQLADQTAAEPANRPAATFMSEGTRLELLERDREAAARAAMGPDAPPLIVTGGEASDIEGDDES